MCPFRLYVMNHRAFRRDNLSRRGKDIMKGYPLSRIDELIFAMIPDPSCSSSLFDLYGGKAHQSLKTHDEIRIIRQSWVVNRHAPKPCTLFKATEMESAPAGNATGYTHVRLSQFDPSSGVVTRRLEVKSHPAFDVLVAASVN